MIHYSTWQSFSSSLFTSFSVSANRSLLTVTIFCSSWRSLSLLASNASSLAFCFILIGIKCARKSSLGIPEGRLLGTSFHMMKIQPCFTVSTIPCYLVIHAVCFVQNNTQFTHNLHKIPFINGSLNLIL